MPGFEVLDFDVFLFFELLYKWVHFVAVCTFCSAEHEEVVGDWGCHGCERLMIIGYHFNIFCFLPKGLFLP